MYDHKRRSYHWKSYGKLRYKYCYSGREKVFFHLPEAGEITIKTRDDDSEYIDSGYTSSSNALIQAKYSYIINELERKHITSARLYCISGYYDSNGEYIPRPDSLTKVYSSLARFVKRIAPYTELTETRVSMSDENYGKEYEYARKVYITQACLELKVNEGYELR